LGAAKEIVKRVSVVFLNPLNTIYSSPVYNPHLWNIQISCQQETSVRYIQYRVAVLYTFALLT